ncbi:MAG: LysR family transcriptional regulator [Shimia sp.]|uniref:LysR family transcriptional regulator n=2 Tax=Shimia sp. TaxID=1954381 RepID=UPI004059A282
MMKIDTLRCFSTVAQLGNLSEAAARLGRTPSALSMSLKQLEAHLGARLFETDRKNKLTPLGLEVFRLAQVQLRQFDDTVISIENAAKAPQGLIKVASIPSAAGLALPRSIAALMDLHPHLKVELRDMDSAMVAEALLNGKADVGIASGNQSLNDVECITLFEDTFGLLCGAAHPLALQQTPPSLHEVFKHPFMSNKLCGHIDLADVRNALADAKLTVHNTHSLIAMAQTNNWVTILPKSVAYNLSGKLNFRAIDGLNDRRTVSLLISQRARFPKVLEDFSKLLLQSDWT